MFCLFYTLEVCLSWEGVLLQPIQQLSVIASTSELVLGGMYVCVHQPRHQELACGRIEERGRSALFSFNRLHTYFGSNIMYFTNKSTKSCCFIVHSVDSNES